MPMPAERCQHMLDALQSILQYTQGANLASYLANGMLRDSCCYQFVILGEAAKDLARLAAPQISRHAPGLVRQLSHANKLRCKLVHDYRQLDQRMIWNAIRGNAPVLLQDLARLRPYL